MLDYTLRYIQKKKHHELTENTHFGEAQKLQELFQAQEGCGRKGINK
jgi:hypothetical protein